MKDCPKIVLAQLPHPAYTERNIPLAAGYLKSSAYSSRLLDQVDISILESRVADYGGDAVVVDHIISMRPDVVGFSFYLWNAVRNIHIIQRLKAKLPNVIIIAGGPEIREDGDYLRAYSEIDVGFIGEGELAFAQWLKHIVANSPTLENIPGISYRIDQDVVVNDLPGQMVDVNEIPSPYLMGYIDPKDYDLVYVFTMRGCVHKCKYCSWTSGGRLRPYSMDTICAELDLTIKAGISRFHIWDSAFNLSPVFEEFCSILGVVNVDRIISPVCFLHANMVNQHTVDLLTKANFVGVEIGLQSTNPLAMRNINRRFHKERFLQATRLLREAQIPVITDVILGLPGDTIHGFEETMSFASHNQLECSMFNLSLGHGNQLREDRDTFGAEMQDKPPFYVTRTNTFSNDDLKHAIGKYNVISSDYNRLTDLAYPVILQRLQLEEVEFGDGKPSFPITNITLEVHHSQSLSSIARTANLICGKIGSSLSLLVICESLSSSIESIKALVAPIAAANPHLTWDVLIEPREVPSASDVAEIKSFIHRERVFLDYRDVFISEFSDHPRRAGINVFMILSERLINRKEADGLDAIQKVRIDSRESVLRVFQHIQSLPSMGVLIELGENIDSSSIEDVMEEIKARNTDDRSMFFKDWVIQNMWNSKFANVTPHNLVRSELLIDKELGVFYNLSTKSNLWWDAVLKWNFVRDEYSQEDIEDMLVKKIAERIDSLRLQA